MPGKPVPLRQRSYAIQPGVAWFSALPGGRAGGVPQPQRGCAEGPNVWVTLFRMGCDIENPSSRCPFRLIRARAGNLPAWCPGTTPLGLFILWEWTQGSASAAQPWALGQNPVGIPGGKIGQRLCTIPPRIRVHPRFPLPNVNDVVPYSPGLCGWPHYPGGAREGCHNHNVVVPWVRTCGLPRTGRVEMLQSHLALRIPPDPGTCWQPSRMVPRHNPVGVVYIVGVDPG